MSSPRPGWPWTRAPRVRISGPITRSSWTPEGGTVETIEHHLLVRDVFRIVFFLPHDHFDLAPGMSRFKSAMGPAGPDKEWHHIIEQTPGNVKRFGGESLHNTGNITALDKTLHTEVGRLYSSIRYDITGSFLTVRKWLGGQSYEAQREFGLQAIRNVESGIW